eukprot:9358280-Ditylum_brightwellii.AAC.1
MLWERRMGDLFCSGFTIVDIAIDILQQYSVALQEGRGEVSIVTAYAASAAYAAHIYWCCCGCSSYLPP